MRQQALGGGCRRPAARDGFAGARAGEGRLAGVGVGHAGVVAGPPDLRVVIAEGLLASHDEGLTGVLGHPRFAGIDDSLLDHGSPLPEALTRLVEARSGVRPGTPRQAKSRAVEVRLAVARFEVDRGIEVGGRVVET